MAEEGSAIFMDKVRKTEEESTRTQDRVAKLMAQKRKMVGHLGQV